MGTNGDLTHVLDQLVAGQVGRDAAEARIRQLLNQPLGFATLDHHRPQRCGIPEVVYAAGKTPAQVVSIARALVERCGFALLTRCEAGHTDVLTGAFEQITCASRQGAVLVGSPPPETGTAIPVITAGTSDEAAAEEAELTCRALGQPTDRINDVGVAGLSRTVDAVAQLDPNVAVIICLAGMEGALPSVIGGLVDVPVIAVPTSVGYGAAEGGVAAALGMLSSCAAGVSVVNIDNGFGAAYVATLIQRQVDRARSGQAS